MRVSQELMHPFLVRMQIKYNTHTLRESRFLLSHFELQNYFSIAPPVCNIVVPEGAYNDNFLNLRYFYIYIGS
jgi:hypothetical protein